MSGSWLARRAAVVRRARTLETKMGEASPYHGHFTWDAQQALDELHDHQARKLVASVRIEVTEGDMVDVRAYISTPDGDRRAYRSAEHVARTPELLAAYTEQMEAQMEQLVERMRRFQQFAVIVSAWDTYKKGA